MREEQGLDQVYEEDESLVPQEELPIWSSSLLGAPRAAHTHKKESIDEVAHNHRNKEFVLQF
jgi:hypothetical protein